MKKLIVIFILISTCSFAQHKHVDSLLKVLTNCVEDSNKVNTLNDLCKELRNVGSYDSALTYANKAKTLSKILGYKKGLSLAYNYIGQIYANQGNYNEALKNHFEALTIREQTNDKKGIASSYNNLATIYKNEGDYSDAIVYYKKSLSLSQLTNDKRGIAVSYNNIGLTYFEQNLLKDALTNYFASLKLYKELRNKRSIALSYNNIGLVYGNMGYYNEAIRYFSMSLQLMEEVEFKEGSESAHVNLAETYNKIKQYTKAEKHGLIALDLSKQINDMEGIYQANLSLSETYDATGRHLQALECYKTSMIARDSLKNEENYKKMLSLQMKHEFEKKEAASKVEQEKKDILLAKESESQKTIIYAAIVLLAILLFISLYIFNRYKVAKQQKQTIESLLKEVHHRVKNNLQVISSILNLQMGYLNDETALNVFQDCKNRVYAMASIHEKLYSGGDLTKIKLRDYVQNLITQLISTYNIKFKIETDIQVNVQNLDLDNLITIGLLTNEIVSNSLKYAFTSDKNKNLIVFKLDHFGNNQYNLQIGDNGIGTNINLEDSHESFGLELIKILASQLNGTINRLPSEKGVIFEIKFTILP